MESEDRLQANCFQWFWNTFPDLRGLLFAIPNGGKRDAREAMKFKATGLVSGIPDLCFCYHESVYFFELKTEIGRLSDAQVKIHSVLSKHGFPIYIIRDLQTFKDLINGII